MRVSIVIATYNRAKLLGETLKSIARVLDDDIQFEIIVVNNNSADDTPIIAESFKSTIPRLQVLLETRQGLSYARNTGILAGTGDVVIFLDDDIEIDIHWLPRLLDPFNSPSVAVVGGKVLPFGMQEFPDWLPREYGFLASVFDPSDSVCEVDKVMGANFAVRRATFDAVGLFDINLGRKGSKLLGGEEVELFHRIQNFGHKIYYTPHSVVWHKISEKLKKEYIEDYAYWLGVSEAVIDRNVISGPKHFLKTVRSAIFPSTVYALQEFIKRHDVTSSMRYTIKRNYARGYISYKKEMASLAQ